MGDMSGTNAVDEIAMRARAGSRSLPFLTDILGNSLNDRLLFAVPKSTLYTHTLAVDKG
jgi:ATP phosphoribosyltransferase